MSGGDGKRRGVVAAGHTLTAEAGAQILRDGGNAVDAAVCAVLTSFAVESPLTGLGAGGFMLVHTTSREDHLIDFFVEVPGRGADPGKRANLVPANVFFDQTPQVFNIGAAACGVPGTAMGLWEVSRRFGSMPFSELIKPGVSYARDGHRVSGMLAYIYTILEPVLTEYAETRHLYAPHGHMLVEGDSFRFPELADSLELLAEEGPDPFYKGDIARRVSEWVLERGGMITTEDMAAYRPIERPSVRAGYRGREVLTNPPPSSGGILIAFCLDLLERLGSEPDLHVLVEVMAEANHVRTEEFNRGLYGPGFMEKFLCEERLEEACARVAGRLEAARAAGGGSSGTDRRDRRRSGGDALPGNGSDTSGGSGGGTDPVGSTTHIAVIDSEGGSASVTCSNGTGSGILVPGTGFHLNNMLGEEDLHPLGFHVHEPGTRVTSMMAPTVVLHEGMTEMALGSAGSNRLRSAILQVIMSVVDHGMPVGEAIRRGRAHFEEEVLHVEPGVDPKEVDRLGTLGYEVNRFRDLNLYFGGVQAAVRDPETGRLSGGGDPRRGGTAVVL